MCGICGIVSRRPITEAGRIRRMQEALHHRGPDSAGQFHEDQIALAVQRLSIIDLVHGAQPLYNEDASLVLIANGEIYNYIELRSDLMSRGHTFKTDSDCETILHLYEDSGLDCVHHLRGMFAFALWDQKKRRLFLARDRAGEKPLYLFETEGLLLFASEMKAILSSGLVPFVIDPHAVDLFFHYGFVPEPATPLKDVRKLPAGHLMTVEVDNWSVVQKCYWRMQDAPPLDGNPAEKVREELETISKIIIRSDVPVGIALSGGLDSSAIMSLVSKHYPDQLHAFSVGYPGSPSFDERQDARRFAAYSGIPCHEIELSVDQVVRSFPDLIRQTDDPIADISGSGYFAVMKAARDHNVPVMLQGHGGDELFWGYPWVVQAAKETNEKSILKTGGWPSIARAYMELRGPQRWSRWGIRSWILSGAGLRQSWEKFSRHRKIPSEQAIFYDLTPDFVIAQREVKSLYTTDFMNKLKDSSPCDLFTFHDSWESTEILLTTLIHQTYLLENGMVQADRLSMASSVEARLPLVDYKLIETVIGLRRRNSDLHSPAKQWFKDALRDTVPDWVLERPKRGFQPPTREWHAAIFAAYGSQLDDGYLVEEKILTPAAATQLCHGSFPKGSYLPLSYKALVLELWCRTFSSLCSAPPQELNALALDPKNLGGV